MTTLRNSSLPGISQTPTVKSCVVLEVVEPVRPALANGLSRAIIVVFLLGISIPSAGFLLKSAKPIRSEKRNLRAAPTLSLERWALQVFPTMFEAYFDDRIGYRKELIALRQFAQHRLFNDSPSDFVWIGQNGWLFVNPLPAHGGLPALHPDPQPNIDAWAKVFQTRHQQLQAKQIRYLVVVAREKSTIYPEHLADTQQRHPLIDPMPRLCEQLRDMPVSILDLKPVLLEAKSHDPRRLYHKTDSHWNDDGALVGYQAIRQRLEESLPGYRGKSAADFDREFDLDLEGDLAVLLGRKHAAEKIDILRERGSPATELSAAIVDSALASDPGRLAYLPTRITESSTGRARVLLVHDSFGVNVRPMLSSDCQRLVCVGSYGLPRELIEQEKPEIVIQLLVERTLRMAPPREAAPTP